MRRSFQKFEETLFYSLELCSLCLSSFASLSLYSCRIIAVTELRFRLNFVQACPVFTLFAILNNRFLCLICRLINVLIHCGSFGLIITVLFGIDSLAALIIKSVTLTAISLKLFTGEINPQIVCSNRFLYLG